MTRVRTRAATSREANRTRVRATATFQTESVAGSGSVDVYTVPPGFELEVRRVQFDGGWIADDGSNLGVRAVPFSALGVDAQYLRSGTRIEWAKPAGVPPITGPCVPGIQTWSEEEGPLITGGEIFQVRVRLDSAFARGQSVTISLEGILSKVGSLK